MKNITAPLSIIVFLLISISPAFALCVKVSKANIRTGPGTSYDKAWEVYKYMPFKTVGKSLSDEWYAVEDMDGDVNWIHKNLVSSKFRCAAVKTEEVNVRKGPGTNYSKSPLSPATQYYSFKVLRQKGDWVRVQDEWDNIGWIHRSFLWIQ